MKNTIITATIAFMALFSHAQAEPAWCEEVRSSLSTHNISTPVLERESPRGMAGIIADLSHQCDKSKTIAALVDGNEEDIIAYTKMVEDQFGITQWAMLNSPEGYLSKATFAMRVEWRETLFFSQWQSANADADATTGEQLYSTMILLDHLEELLGER